MNARWKSLLCFALFIVVHYSTFASDGYKVKTVVIDAGHGGKDPGASGQAKNYEKDIALIVALKLGDYISKNFPDITVIYTRKTDVFIELHERAEIANRAKADLFISVHCNSSTNKEIYGTSTYVLGLHRTEANLEVAKRENAVIDLEDNRDKHYDFDPNSPEGHIIMSMKQNAFLDQSIACAQHAEEQMESYGKRKSLGVKQAGFYVLYKTAMPSLLCEIGFISNKEEEAFLASTKGQDYAATSLYNAFRVYKDQMEKDGGKLNVINTNPDSETEKQGGTAQADGGKKPVDSNVGAGGKMKDPFSNTAADEAAAKAEAERVANEKREADRKAAEQAVASAKAKSDAEAKAKADDDAKARADAAAKAEEERKKNEAQKMSAPTATISDTQTVKGGGYSVAPRDKEEEERLAAKAAAEAKARAEAQKAAADAEAERVANEQAAKKKAQEEATAKADAKAKADAAAEADRVAAANAAAKKKADEQAAAQAKADAAAKAKADADADAKAKADAAAKKKADDLGAAQAKAKADADAKAEAAQRDKEAERKAKVTTTLKNEVVTFRIQICALQNPFQNFDATQKKLGYIDTEKLPNGLTRYMTGNYKTYEEAMKHLPFVQKEGYKEAFIIAYNGTERLDIKQTNDFRMREEAKKRVAK